MKYIIFVMPLFLTSCASVNSPEDYYKQRIRQSLPEDAIDRGPNANNNILDSQDGGTYYNRNVQIFGATY